MIKSFADSLTGKIFRGDELTRKKPDNWVISASIKPRNASSSSTIPPKKIC